MPYTKEYEAIFGKNSRRNGFLLRRTQTLSCKNVDEWNNVLSHLTDYLQTHNLVKTLEKAWENYPEYSHCLFDEIPGGESLNGLIEHYKRNKTLKKKLKQSKESNTELQKQIKKLKRENEQLTHDINKKQKDLEDANEKYAQKNTELEVANTQLRKYDDARQAEEVAQILAEFGTTTYVQTNIRSKRTRKSNFAPLVID